MKKLIRCNQNKQALKAIWYPGNENEYVLVPDDENMDDSMDVKGIQVSLEDDNNWHVYLAEGIHITKDMDHFYSFDEAVGCAENIIKQLGYEIESFSYQF